MKEMNVNDFNYNIFNIKKDWALLTAGNEEEFNTMTISWLELGHLWNKNVATIFVRPQRYTKEFVDKEDYFTISILPNEYINELAYLGRVSGRDEDKLNSTTINPEFTSNTVYMREAEIVFICKKIYVSQFDSNKFITDDIKEDMYQMEDYSYVYIGEIEKILVK